ncbi:hypothetical protein ACN27E_09795 [Mycobacterium sp. WMMD1722]|uniref:hypothetical protein n=1 Tax=Mycobacterium sp. WMMD1722 TaxID=3404117 RepID=UPI003BF463BC
MTDADLSVLERWTEPLATLRDPGLSVWAMAAWQSVKDEQRHRLEGGYAYAACWPALGWLSTEHLVFLGPLVSMLHDAGSSVLTAWVELVSDQFVAEMAERIEGTGS